MEVCGRRLVSKESIAAEVSLLRLLSRVGTLKELAECRDLSDWARSTRLLRGSGYNDMLEASLSVSRQI